MAQSVLWAVLRSRKDQSQPQIQLELDLPVHGAAAGLLLLPWNSSALVESQARSDAKL